MTQVPTVEVLGIVIPILAVTGVFVLVGLKGWANHQLRMHGTAGVETEHLTEAMQRLQDEIGAVREDVVELQERVEFTERMLLEVKSRNALGPGDPA